MKYQPQVGHPTNLNEKVAAHIISHVEGNYVIGQVARMAKIPKETLRRWLRRGEEEANADDWSQYAQLWVEFEHKRGLEIKEILADVKNRKTNWQASWQLLTSIAREDFGVEAVEYKELLELFNKLSEAFKRFSENPLQSQGAINHGREVDSESCVKEQGSPSQETRSEEG